MPEPAVNYYKTRIAPTPSGFLHIGNVLSFAVTAYMAKQHGAKILLRIDDIDQTRANPQYVQDIFDTLDFLDIPWDEGPQDTEDFEVQYSQMHRVELYNKALQQLADNNLVYACDCSRKQLSETICHCRGKKLPLGNDNVSWRLIAHPSNKIAVKAYKGGIAEFEVPIEMQDFVVRKKDGFPAYQLTSVIDDLHYGVDLVVRGEDLWQSTLMQHQLAKALKLDDFGNVTFYHHKLIKDSEGNKLSKSAGVTSIKYLREQGKNASNIYNLIGNILRLNTPINNWIELASAVLNKQ